MCVSKEVTKTSYFLDFNLLLITTENEITTCTDVPSAGKFDKLDCRKWNMYLMQKIRKHEGVQVPTTTLQLLPNDKDQNCKTGWGMQTYLHKKKRSSKLEHYVIELQ